METFSALLAICAGNSPASGEFPAQRPVTRSFDVFFDLSLNKRLRKQSWGWWFETLSHPLWRHCNDQSPIHISPWRASFVYDIVYCDNCPDNEPWYVLLALYVLTRYHHYICKATHLITAGEIRSCPPCTICQQTGCTWMKHGTHRSWLDPAAFHQISLNIISGISK